MAHLNRMVGKVTVTEFSIDPGLNTFHTTAIVLPLPPTGEGHASFNSPLVASLASGKKTDIRLVAKFDPLNMILDGNHVNETTEGLGFKATIEPPGQALIHMLHVTFSKDLRPSQVVLDLRNPFDIAIALSTISTNLTLSFASADESSERLILPIGAEYMPAQHLAPGGDGNLSELTLPGIKINPTLVPGLTPDYIHKLGQAVLKGGLWIMLGELKLELNYEFRGNLAGTENTAAGGLILNFASNT